MSFTDNGDKERVQAATDLVRLVGEQVQLKPKGREFLGLCPFHDDKSPSMHVSAAKQIYKCFSCGAGGDVFSFAMNYHKMSFVEALKYLAERAGIELTPWQPTRGGKSNDDNSEAGPSPRKRIAAANGQAVSFYQTLLRHPEHGQIARDYLSRRGISGEMVEAFGLGYAPDRWDGLVQMIRSRAWPRPDFADAGLIKARQTGDGDFDFLRHRLVFPIFDAIGRPIAFGGRKLRDEDEPKYLNSPETALFHKSATLYGLHLAKKPIIDRRTAVIVEGYTDVIACHQAGATNVVAALGTALTAEHVRELRRYCDQVILVMDGDAAGQKAADRAIEVFLTGDLDVSLAVLPEGQDPDELLKAGGLDAWSQVLAEAKDALAFAFGRVEARLQAAATVTGRQRVAEAFLGQLVDLGLARSGAVRRSFVVQQLAAMLHLTEAVVDQLLDARAPRNTSSPPPPPPPPEVTPETGLGHPARPPQSPGRTGENRAAAAVALGISRSKIKAVGKAERRLMAALVRHNDLFHDTLHDGSVVDEAFSPGELSHSAHRALYERIYNPLAEGQPLTLAGLSGTLAAEGEDLLCRCLTTADVELEQTLPDELREGENLPPAEMVEQALRASLQEAAAVMLRFRRDCDYARDRLEVLRPRDGQPVSDPTGASPLDAQRDSDSGFADEFARGPSPPNEKDQQAALLRKLMQARRSDPSPGRIARIRP